ncbi:hypothetical protein CW684_02630 [Macrococcoides caseolyticum]|uniref:lipopolysaccharide biosynthesis protein n=1 Tax=Macrococcoides caseolyticum TaxID=69966 RepID=UPI000C349971|nr:hypothetical protein [Macrococcus caseolyticus]PKE45069.1 hypothetical protein CW666_00610 [Macrococcus caseolyticus]PKF21990.1 hypothetical protein CW684_02630 [Macrococcus caseolyticus]PKF36379.1 hypothetical protein CW687_02630 [Macrococcus caseolyticus]
MSGKNKFLIFVIGNISYGISQWVILLGILKIFGVYDAGIYSLGVAIISPLVLFFSLGLNTLYVTDKKFDYNIYAYNRNFYTVFLFITYSIILVLLNKNTEMFILLIFIGFHKILETQFDMIFAYYIEKKQQHKIGKIKLVQSFMIIIAFIVFGIFLKNLTYIFILINILFFIQLFYYDKVLGTSFKIKFNRELLKSGLLISFALLLSSLNTNIPKYYLELNGSTEYVGIFTSIIILYAAGKIIFQSIYSFLLPKIVENINNTKTTKKYFMIVNTSIVLLSLILLVISYATFDFWVPLIFRSDFLKYKFEIMLSVLGSFLIFQSILMDLFINSYKNYRSNLISQIIVIIFVCLSLFIFKDLNILKNAIISFLTFGLSVCITKTLIANRLIRR